MLGRAQILIGDDSVVSEDCWLNVNNRIPGRIAIDIGQQCFIGRRNFLSSGAWIRFGDYVLTANDCQFLGSTHVIDDPMRPVISTGTTDTHCIVIGANTFLGAGARVLGHVRIGHGCVIGAGALVTSDLPPFSQAHGSPARMIRRYSAARACWVAVQDWSVDDAVGLPDEAAYVALLKTHGPVRMPLLAAGGDMGNC